MTINKDGSLQNSTKIAETLFLANIGPVECLAASTGQAGITIVILRESLKGRPKNPSGNAEGILHFVQDDSEKTRMTMRKLKGM